MFNYYDEFPHQIEVGTIERVGKYPNQSEKFVVKSSTHGFLDTPSSNETLQYHQLDMKVTRVLYTPYTFKFDNKKTLFKYDGKVYQCISEPDNQGGMNEINRTLLEVTPYS